MFCFVLFCFVASNCESNTHKQTKKKQNKKKRHQAYFDHNTNLLIWNTNNRKWVRKDFKPFKGRWRDSLGHVINIDENGTVKYVVPKDLGVYFAKIVGFYKIAITYQSHLFQAKLISKNDLKWDNGSVWKRVDKPEQCLIM